MGNRYKYVQRKWEIDTNMYSVDSFSIRHSFFPVYGILVFPFAGTWTNKPQDTFWWIPPVTGLRQPVHPGPSNSWTWILTLLMHTCTHTNGCFNRTTAPAAGWDPMLPAIATEELSQSIICHSSSWLRCVETSSLSCNLIQAMKV